MLPPWSPRPLVLVPRRQPHKLNGALDFLSVLTDKDIVDPLTGMARYAAVPVSVEPA